MEDRVRGLENRLMKVETFLGIDDPESGLRKEINDIKEAQAALFKLTRAVHARMTLAIGGGAVLMSAVQIGLQIYLAHAGAK